jgi:hypothetical protein
MLKDIAKKAAAMFKGQPPERPMQKITRPRSGGEDVPLGVQLRRVHLPHPKGRKIPRRGIGHVYTGLKRGGICVLPSGTRYVMQYNGWRRLVA